MSFALPVSRLKHPASLLPGIALAAALALAPAPASAQSSNPTLPMAARVKGSATAPVTVYEMADFQCPVCGRFFREIWPTLDKEYVATGKVRWVFINFPLSQIHANAEAAAEFAVCAGTQGKFWQAHDMLYNNQENWEKLKDPVPYFQSKIASLGLKSDAMTTCLQSGAARSMVKDDALGAERSGAHSTPNFYIEGGIMEGLYPIEVFRKVLDSVVKAKSKK